MCYLYFSFNNPLCVFMGKPFRNHKTCLEIDFSGGNTTQCQQLIATESMLLDIADAKLSQQWRVQGVWLSYLV